MKKNIATVIVVMSFLMGSHNSNAIELTWGDKALAAAAGLKLLTSYAMHAKSAGQYDTLIDFCIETNASHYSDRTRVYLQEQIENCGVTATVVPITGIILSGDERMSGAVIPGKNNIFYLNIPIADVSSLNEIVAKLDNNEPLLQQEQEKLNEIIFLVSHEMNHVKKMVRGASYASREFSWKKEGLRVGIAAAIAMALSKRCNVSYKVQFPVWTFLEAFYTIRTLCNEEYACDIESIEDVGVLKGGRRWLASDVKEYVDAFFTQSNMLDIYKEFPNFFCSFFTHHPDPNARIAAIDKKIAELESQHSAA